MGVEFYACKRCGESRYEEYVYHCDKCEHSLCTRCVVNDDIGDDYAHSYCVIFDGTQAMKDKYGIDDEDIAKGYIKEGDVIDDAGIDPKYCPFCQGEAVAEIDVLKYLLKKYGLDYEEIKREYLTNK